MGMCQSQGQDTCNDDEQAGVKESHGMGIAGVCVLIGNV